MSFEFLKLILHFPPLRVIIRRMRDLIFEFYYMDIDKVKKVYMIGIKGVGMTMLAQFLKSRGIEVSGSDIKEKFMTDQVLRDSGIKVIEGFSEKNMPSQADLIIYSTAYNSQTNPEVARAGERSVPLLTYAQALGEVFNNYYGIAVTGSHGKTTTAAWLGYVLDKCGLAPNVLVGSRVPQFKGSGLVGDSDYLVAELDEYQNKFRYFSPKIVLLNNIEYDHPDFFPDEESYIQVFIDLIKKIPSTGTLLANYDDPLVRKIAAVNCKGKVVSYGIKEYADLIAYDLVQKDGQNFFKVKFGLEEEEGPEETALGGFVTNLVGKHNVSNALAIIALGLELDLDLASLRTHLEDFEGASRRLEVLGKFKGVPIIDDYAHHPTEIKTTLEAIRKNYPEKKIVTVFHPHTFTRTKALLKEFSESFKDSDKVIVVDIYGSAREEQGGVHSRDLVEGINNLENKDKASYISTLEEVEKHLRKNIASDEVVVLMGAGDVFRVGEKLLKK